MGSEETKQHVVSILGENTERSNKAPNDQAKSTLSNLVNRWRDFFKKHSSAERKAILLLSVAAVFLDPLFFYIPVVKNASTCLGLDNNLRIIVVVFRSFVDVLHTILWCHHSLPSVQGQYRLIPAWKGQCCLILAWTVAILALLPLPQVVILAVSWQLLTVKLLKPILLIQFAIRLCRIIPAYKDATRSSDMLHIYSWFAAAFNLVMYTLASNILGAFWYYRAVERNVDCWRKACHKNQTLCDGSSLYCDDTSRYNEFLHKRCSKPQSLGIAPFDYGIYDEAFQTIIIEKDTHFLDKFFQCFWWGLRNLSSLGQNLKTGSYLWDSLFAIAIAICGLVLFAFLIGNMQTYLQTKTPAKLERTKQRKNYLKGWKPFFLLPKELRREVTWCEDPKWQETTEVNLESLLNNTPTELRKKLRPHLCKNMFIKIPEFECLRKELCTLARPVVFPERSYIFREGDPIHEAVFIVDGNLLSYSNRNTATRFPAKQLSAGCFFGKELLEQLLKQEPQQQQTPDESSLDLPIASETIRAATKVEAFVLPAKDLIKAYASYSKRATDIQNAWRKFVKSKREGKPQEGEKDSSIKKTKN